MNFGNNLKYLRNLKKESQGDIAKLVGKKQNLVSRWETGEREPTTGDLLILSNHYNVPLQVLYEYETKEFIDFINNNEIKHTTREEVLKSIEDFRWNADLSPSAEQALDLAITIIKNDSNK